jgi:cytochrome c-type biogenesis protein
VRAQYPQERDFLLRERTMNILPLVLTAAVVDSFQPCAFSVLLLTIGFLFSLGKERGKVLFIGLTYVFGIFIAYVAIGLGILGALGAFGVPNFAAKIGATILILVGAIEVLGALIPSFPIKLKIPDGAHGRIAALMEKASMPMGFVLGAAVGLFEFPCAGGPYLMILGLLHDTATRWEGLGFLLLYNLIFVLPLIIILAVASSPALLMKVQVWRRGNIRRFKLWTGVVMVLLGAIIFLV